MDQDFIAEAPAVIVIFANETRSARKYGRRGKELYCINDASIFASYIQLAASALGLGSCWVGAFDDDAIRRLLKAPDHLKPAAIIPLGYPDEKPEPKERRKLSDIAHEERFL
ncbi:MAG: nitroreductase family protein [Candidatus Aenigmarchaeota archaeon]|nr:nitroreductase family protein [Candidatus Aenigmarchaeota archaeon]MDI6722849.1 nitroreductase family protein [Candidatus Aenigmarchaeota archaeon]